jgi:hypothetical protein
VNRAGGYSDNQSLLHDYFRDLDSALSSLPRARRTQLVSEIREHVDAALTEQPPRSSAEMRNLLDRVGRPEDIAAAALEEEPGQPRRPMRTGQKVLIASVSAFVLAGLGTGLGFALTSQGPSRGAAAPSPVSSRPSASAAGYGALPAGYYRFTNSTGFSIGVPDGWQIQHVGHYVYIIDPSNVGTFLLIDQSDTPQPNPLLDWEQQAANRASTYPDYHLVRLDSVSYPQAEKAADWEFTYVRDGILVHILNRNVLANAHHAYALYWSTPESDWNAFYHYFQAFAATFRPAQ